MLVLITTVGLVVMAYSHKYMAYDQSYVRFFVYLSLFTASMLGLVLSPNLVQVYVFWELVGMCSYLLIGFWPNRLGAAKACQKAFYYKQDRRLWSLAWHPWALLGYRQP